ncbi:calcium/sodium antiporter [Lutibaculum baratangense]|uniref:Sodium/calcium exchanger n=1 Tax=Lutibaculum baratangense AMV1 TaxID=631454 RepID=V4RFA0_9HYPH|nr:calcium/sodium antiporter [Lutibaculum baratangense]ESR24044.1 sodium/calcium exchanger [Lutibaculum baratangense AMV1]
MTMYLLIVAGLVLLFVGGEALVRGAVLLALRLGVTPLVVGLTVVGFGTSAPELATSISAALSGAPGIALGNVVGSNIANVLLILGLTVVVTPMICDGRTAIRDGLLMVGSGVLLAGLALGGVIGRVEGTILVLALAGYLVYVWRSEKRKVERGEPAEGDDQPTPEPGLGPKLKEAGFLLGGLAGVVLGGQLLVTGAIELAETFGVSDTLIGLTIVAIGTSLPELATSISAAIRKQPEIAYGNVVGSNVFNLLGIAGVTAMTHPLQVSPELLAFDIPFVIGVMAVMALMAFTGRGLSRTEGGVLLAAYAGYMTFLIV